MRNEQWITLALPGEGKAARIAIKFQDARKGTYLLDVTEEEAEELGKKGTKQARRGRKPKAAASSGRPHPLGE